MKILIIQLRRIGDILLTTPAVSYLKIAFPEASIDFLSEPMGEQILSGNPYLIKSHLYDKGSPFSELRRVRNNKYDVVFDFMNNPRSVMLAAMSGAKHVVGFKHGLRSALYKLAVPGLVKPDYVAKRKIDVIQYWMKKNNFPVPPVQSYRPSLFLNHEEEAFADRWLSENKIPSHFVVMAPGCRYRIRTWTPEAFQNTALELTEKKWQVLVAWGPGEEEFVAAVRKGHEDQLKLFPKTSLRQMAALLKRASLLIAPSTGAMHLAVSVGTPTVTVYGSIRPIDWEPIRTEFEKNTRNIALTADNIPCLGCHLNEGCPNQHRCMTELPVDRVLKSCLTILKGDQ